MNIIIWKSRTTSACDAEWHIQKCILQDASKGIGSLLIDTRKICPWGEKNLHYSWLLSASFFALSTTLASSLGLHTLPQSPSSKLLCFITDPHGHFLSKALLRGQAPNSKSPNVFSEKAFNHLTKIVQIPLTSFHSAPYLPRNHKDRQKLMATRRSALQKSSLPSLENIALPKRPAYFWTLLRSMPRRKHTVAARSTWWQSCSPCTPDDGPTAQHHPFSLPE